MYEPEVNNRFESIESLPDQIRMRFSEFRDRVSSRTVLPWGEHCTECNWPTCYTTCELYSPRSDGACRQFVDGMVRMDNKDGLSPYILKLKFKRWAKLWTVGNVQLYSMPEARRKEGMHIAVGALARGVPLPSGVRGRVLRKVSYLRRCAAENPPPSTERPDFFLIECFNPNPRPITLTFTVRLREGSGQAPFQRAVPIAPGYARETIAFGDIAEVIQIHQPFEVEIVPNDCNDTVLYFGLIDFVKEKREGRPAAKAEGKPAAWKCIVWDLDNTLWDGTLIEDGADKISLRQGVVDVIKETDRRGILHSIASKNHHEDAMRVLKMCGIDQYFLHPQISWQPKSQSIAQIASLLNIGVDSLVFVDDQPFEREQVKADLPQVATIDSADYGGIPQRQECQGPVTEESKSRRLMYREQIQRQATQTAYAGNYAQFLKDCRMEIGIQPLDDSNLERVYELAQRTNQMNFSGNRYPLERLREIKGEPLLETHVMRCSDKFGSYGIVGFAVVDTREPRLLDLMFSCRIQGKRVEHAFLTFLLKRYVAGRNQEFHANYRQSPKNAPSGKVFAEMGFETVGEKDGILDLVFRLGREIPDDEILAMREGEP